MAIRSALFTFFFSLLGGCVSPTDLTKVASPAPAASKSFSEGPRAAKIIFRDTAAGSFDASTGATLNSPGSGQAAVRIFNPTNTKIDWPNFLTSAEVMISGTLNAGANQENCARFGSADVDGQALCDFDGDGTKNEFCGLKTEHYRVSEYDCASGATLNGTGGGSDGVAVRVIVNRGSLGANENLMGVIEYEATGLNEVLSDPSSCFTAGYSPTNPNCSDFSWQIFFKRSASDSVVPFATFVPPLLGYVNTTKGQGGSHPSTYQFVMPLASDSQLSVIQLSRIRGLPIGSTGFVSRCDSNSPRCVGLILYSLTLFRM